MSAEAYVRKREEGGGQSSLSADVKFPSSNLSDNLNNFKQATLENHWFTEQTGSRGASVVFEQAPVPLPKTYFTSASKHE